MSTYGGCWGLSATLTWCSRGKSLLSPCDTFPNIHIFIGHPGGTSTTHSSGLMMSSLVRKLRLTYNVARKLVKEIKYPEVISGKFSRALTYDKSTQHQFNSQATALFVKGFGKTWTHKDLHDKFSQFGEIVSAKVSLEDGHKGRGYGFVMFSRDEFAQRAIQEVTNTHLLNCVA